MGAALGAVVGGPWGAGLGGLLGAAVAQEPVPLDEALRQECARHGFALSHWRRPTKTTLHVAVQDAHEKYWQINCGVPEGATLGPIELDDGLYDAFVTTLSRLRSDHGLA